MTQQDRKLYYVDFKLTHFTRKWFYADSLKEAEQMVEALHDNVDVEGLLAEIQPVLNYRIAVEDNPEAANESDIIDPLLMVYPMR